MGALQDADLVVGQLQRGQLRIDLLQAQPERLVQRVDRAVALAGGDDALALSGHLDGRLADEFAVLAALDDDAPGLDREVPFPARNQLAAQQQLERGVGGLEGVTRGLELLDPVDDPAERGLIAGQVVAELLALELDRSPARHVGDQHAHVVPDQLRLDVLVEHRVDLDRRGVQARLVRERGEPYVGLVRVRRDVGDLADRVGDPGQLGQAAVRQHRAPLLELEPRDDAEQVGVAGPLAVAVRGALHVGRARVHGDQRVGHGAGGVVVAVDAEPRPGRRGDRCDHVAELARHHAAVGVAERDDLRAGFGRDAHDLERVGRVGAVTVEEVLRVQEDPLAVTAEVLDGVPDHGQVLLQRGAEGQPDVPVMTLGDKGHDRRARLTQRGDLRVIGRLGAGPAGRAERGELRVLEVQLALSAAEEIGVLGDGARPPALDEADAQAIQLSGDRELVSDRQVQPLLLGAVTQRGVVDVEAVVKHQRSSVS